MENTIRILVVEDNLVVQHYIRGALSTEPCNEIIAVIDNGIDALQAISTLKPDVVLLDLFLPGMDGIDVIRRVMADAPCPIVVLSAELDRKDQDLTFEAQRAGAVSVLAKPVGMEAEQFQQFSQTLCKTIKLMSQVKVTRRWLSTPNTPPPPVIPTSTTAPRTLKDCTLVAIGSSTGGPAALYSILEALGSDFPFSVLIAQHIAVGFATTLSDWLAKTGCPIHIPEQGEVMQRGQVYLSPDNKHLVLGANQTLFHVDNPSARFTPSVDMLFDSVAHNYSGKIAAIILTGMGNDGTAGMHHLYRRGALTIAEDESSCVVFGMPAAAIAAGIVTHTKSLPAICEMFREVHH
ncbi:MAG: chemotaxis-specific protein-glutamate methyltransferase CheB [Pseudomonadales bacterium]